MKYEKQTFTNADVGLDNNDFINCKFENCNLIYRGGSPPNITGCSFGEFRITFADSAANTLNFFSVLHREGFPQAVATIKSIAANQNILGGNGLVH